MPLAPADADPAEVERLRGAYRRVVERIAAAAVRVGRDPGDVLLVGASKTVDAERLRAAVAAGLTTLGENRVQEAAAKQPLVPGATWHLIGPLQSNKARRAIELFDVVETVHELSIATRLDRLAGELRPGRPLSVLLEVNIDEDPAKTGFAPEALPAALPAILELPNLRVEGLMTVGRLAADAETARPTFRALRALAERLREAHSALGPVLSMGMSGDFEAAVEEGATIVRVGTALFGERHPST